MTKEDYIAIVDLLKRRDNQRTYMKQQLDNVIKCQEAADKHRDEINAIQRRLLELGYQGQ